jgi:hypothetical protein
MTVAMRQAKDDDLADLLELMQEFYAESGFALDPDRARAAFLPLLAPGHLGQVWLGELDGQVAGQADLHRGAACTRGSSACIRPS